MNNRIDVTSQVSLFALSMLSLMFTAWGGDLLQVRHQSGHRPHTIQFPHPTQLPSSFPAQDEPLSQPLTLPSPQRGEGRR